MSKKINLQNPKEKLLSGITQAVDAVAITIGPRGKNFCLSNGDIVNDAKRIAEDLVLNDPIENKGATKVRNMVRKISSEVGGGRTACAILYKELCKNGLNLLERGFNGNFIRKGMTLAVKDITEQLEKMAHKVKGKDLEMVATISTENEELGKVIADTINKVGQDGVVTTEESPTLGITVDIADGLKFDKGWISPYMVTNERLEAEYKDIPVFITSKKISLGKDIVPIFEGVTDMGKDSLLIIAEDIDGEALQLCNLVKAQGKLKVLAIKAPGIGDNKKFCLEDLSALTNANVVSEGDWDRAMGVKQAKHPLTGQPVQVKTLAKGILGKARRVLAKKDSTVIVGTGDIKTWITTLKTRKELTDNVWEKDQFTERIAKLQNGIAVIRVGAPSEDEIKYLKLKIEDGVNETKRALEEGIVAGGNVSFLNATKSITPKDNLNEINIGYNLVFKAIEAPLRQIVENSNGSPDVVINKIKESKSLTIGYDSLDNRVVDDMHSQGIIDAVKVVKSVLQYAVAEAGIFLTIGGDNSEELKDD